MSSIKNRLVFYFSSIICLLLIPLVCLLINYYLQSRYQKTLEAVSIEYQVSGSLNNLVVSFGSFLKNPQDGKASQDYLLQKQNVNKLISKLPRSSSNSDIAKRIESTVGFVVEYCDK